MCHFRVTGCGQARLRFFGQNMPATLIRAALLDVVGNDGLRINGSEIYAKMLSPKRLSWSQSVKLVSCIKEVVLVFIAARSSSSTSFQETRAVRMSRVYRRGRFHKCPKNSHQTSPASISRISVELVLIWATDDRCLGMRRCWYAVLVLITKTKRKKKGELSYRGCILTCVVIVYITECSARFWPMCV